MKELVFRHSTPWRTEGSKRRRSLLLTAVILLAAVPVWAQQTKGPTAKTDFKALVDNCWATWGKGDVAKAGEMYAKDAHLVFYDLEPLKYTGWAEYSKGVLPNILDKFASVKFTVNDDLKATERGNVAWTSVTVRADGTLKAAGPMKADIRHTVIWEKRGGRWLIVHEHVSVPSTLPAPPK
jgi:ketosteroid isomerase-like protein